MSEEKYKKRNEWWTAAFNKRDRPDMFKSWNRSKKITKNHLMRILGDYSKKLDSVTHLSNMLSYLILKSESPIVLKEWVDTIDKMITKNNHVSYSEQLLYWFQKAYPKKIEYTLNKWLTKKDLKKTTDSKYQNAMLYIKGYINNRLKNWDNVKNITVNECMHVFSWALLPYFDETVNSRKILAFINTILSEAEQWVPFVEWSKPVY